MTAAKSSHPSKSNEEIRKALVMVALNVSGDTWIMIDGQYYINDTGKLGDAISRVAKAMQKQLVENDPRRWYPENHQPGKHWALDAAWQILDTLPLEALSKTQRAYLAGLIQGALIRAAKDGTLKSEALATLPKLKPEG